MWAAFKLIPLGARLGILFGIIALFIASLTSVGFIYYNKGLNVSKVEVQKYENKVATLNSKLKTAQGKIDVQIVTEYKDRVSVVKETVYKNKDVIRKIVEYRDTNNIPQFNLSKGWIYAYNQSILDLPVDPLLASDITPSTVKDMLALANTIIPNNGICLTNKEKLESLQKWIVDTEKSHEKINNSN